MSVLLLGAALLLATPSPASAPSPGAAASAGEDLAILDTEAGIVKIQLLPAKAPRHVEKFKQLARQGFYDGTTFHRVIPDYIVQGGSPTSKDADPKNDNFGGPGFTIKAEFNELLHERGTVSMARDVNDPDSAGSQFFVSLARSPQLDQIKFTIFGKVIAGMDVFDKIAAAPRDAENYDRPLQPVVVRKPTVGATSAVQVAAKPGASPAAAKPAASAAPATAGAAKPSPTPVAGTASVATAKLAVTPSPAPAGPTAGAKGAKVTLAQDMVNVREGPSTDKPVLQRLPKGTELPVKSRQGEWIGVELSGGKVGYIRKDMVAIP